MRILSTCHAHTTWCDGKSPAEETVLAALEKGFLSLGFTSHAPQHFDLPCAVDPDKEWDYIREIHGLREKYRDRIRIFCGVERDLFSCADTAPYDYYIASVHYIPCGSRMMAVDASPDGCLELYRDFFGCDGIRLAKAYYSLVAAYARAFRPPVIGHLDLIKKSNGILGMFDENDPAYIETVAETLRVIRDAGSLLEVNTGGIARGYITETYPSLPILKMWRGMGGEVIAGTDCHRAKDLDCALDILPDLLASAGFSCIHVLTAGAGLFERVSLSDPSAPAPKSPNHRTEMESRCF